ncbi:helix-turn-helix transcriptional regulator, partial [Streptomyces sp. SBT349]|uniref:helix-turn-helix transcriptional regulator n=1 Tax=Streptomyces sp. SBT349 TaxID=1580539 RepID=UPI00066CD950
MPNEDELFAAVDDLLSRGKPRLPPPAERVRLREAAGLTQGDIAEVLRARRETVNAWEAGRTEPRPPRLQAYIRLLEGWAARYPAPVEPPRPRTPPTSARPSSVSRRPGKPRAATTTAPPAPAPIPAVDAGGRFPAGPLAVLDGDGIAHLADGRTLQCPAATVAQLADWALDAGLGQERLHRAGRDADPLIVLTAAATEHLGLPAVLADRRGLRLSEDHPAVRDLTAAGWQLTRRGFGPWARVYRPVEAGGRRQCAQFAVLPWEALDERAWGRTDRMDPPAIAWVLGTYALRVLTPRGSTAVNGLELMTALRPP